MIALLAAGVYVYGLSTIDLGASTGPSHEQRETFKQGLQIGVRGSEIHTVLTGTCNLLGARSLTASTSIGYDCAVPGVVSTDRVFIMAPKTIPVQNTFGTYFAKDAYASTTSGYITVDIYNGTGAATTSPSTTVLTGWRYLIIRTP